MIGQASTAFLKKSSKKRFALRPRLFPQPPQQKSKNFLVLFFKKELLCCS